LSKVKRDDGEQGLTRFRSDEERREDDGEDDGGTGMGELEGREALARID